MESEIEGSFEDLNDREIAKNLNEPEGKVRERRKDQGFLRLEDFREDDESERDLEIGFELDEMRKRQLQGFLGEKVCSLMENRVKNLLSDHVKPNWTLKRKAELISEDSLGYSIGSQPRNRGEIEIDGATVKHFDADKEEIEEKIREKCFRTSEDLFKSFQKVRNPWIDFSFYALKTEGKVVQSFNVKNFSKSAIDAGETMEIEIPVVKDFKIAALEVKTTEDDEERLLSENQRKVRKVAKDSPFIDFFTLKIDTTFDQLDIPEQFSGNLKKHS